MRQLALWIVGAYHCSGGSSGYFSEYSQDPVNEVG